MQTLGGAYIIVSAYLSSRTIHRVRARAHVLLLVQLYPYKGGVFLSFNNHITGLSSDVLKKEIKRRAGVCIRIKRLLKPLRKMAGDQRKHGEEGTTGVQETDCTDRRKRWTM